MTAQYEIIIAGNPTMPATQTVTQGDFRVSVGPAFLLRRLTVLFPYFQITRPTFAFRIERLTNANTESNLRFYLQQNDESRQDYVYDVSTMEVGQTRYYRSAPTLLHRSGDAFIALEKPSEFWVLYA